MKLPVSVLILTKNEEKDLPGCLESVAWSDDIHVYDSYSEDTTVAIAASFGASVTRRLFDNWATHQNWGLDNIEFKNSWVFYIDADERVSDGLRESIGEAIENAGEVVAFYVTRRDFWNNRWLRHVQATSQYARLFIPSRVRYQRLVNPVTIINGKTAELKGYLDHFPFSKGVAHWIDRHNSYSSFEAKEITLRQPSRVEWAPAFFARDISIRRAAQKKLFYMLPGRPLLKFLLLYIARGGFLDGSAGFHYSILQSVYEYFIVQKTEELSRQSQK